MMPKNANGQRLGAELRRHDIPTAPYVFGIGIMGGSGFSLLGFHVVHFLKGFGTLFPTLFGSLIPLGLSLLLTGLAIWAHWQGFDDRIVVRMGMGCVIGMAVLIGVSVASITYQQSKGVMMVDHLFVITNHVTVGAILGTLLGLYDGQRFVRGRRLRREQERAERLSDGMTILNRVLRHDIRNTVNIILGNVNLIQGGSTDLTIATETIRNKATELEAMGDRARQLQQLLEREVVGTSTIDLAPTLRAKLLKLRNEHPNLAVEMDIPESAEVQATSLISDVLDELIENAIEHNDSEPPQIEVSVSSPDASIQADGGTPGPVTITFRDNGPGIPDAEIEVLEQGYETDLEHLSGLGLWFVNKVVQESGGQVSFETNEPRGSVVELRLPRPADQ